MSRYILFAYLLLSFACSNNTPPATEPVPADSTQGPTSGLSVTQDNSSTSEAKPENKEPSTTPSQPTISGKSPRTAVSTPKVKSSAPNQEDKTTAAQVTVAQSSSAEAKPGMPQLPDSKQSEATTKPSSQAPSHQAFDALLQQYVDSKGQVNYGALKKAEDQLEAYLSTLAIASPGEGWTKNEALAYWMNAYNAATLQLILKNWPLQSIIDLHGGKPWDVKWIVLAEKTYSLNQIEHQIIRPQFNDARIHFAVNCAAQSCPPLHNRAFAAQGLHTTLDRLTKTFINNQTFNRTDGQKAQVSKLFDWYQEDFGDVRNYLNNYLNTPLKEDVEISYLDYDWALNGR